MLEYFRTFNAKRIFEIQRISSFYYHHYYDVNKIAFFQFVSITSPFNFFQILIPNIFLLDQLNGISNLFATRWKSTPNFRILKKIITLFGSILCRTSDRRGGNNRVVTQVET
mmetsp:Transcript_33415/g.38031  ORF Transcript_33415/g.38031 Transcript_33415/m.38031 type:complete len:112 (+) Transcript_33415:42-377(+)